MLALNRLLVALVAAAVSATGLADAALANTVCNGTLTGKVNGGVSVPAGNSCTLSGATIDGGVSVTGGTLNTVNSRINGGLAINGATGPNFICSTIINGGATIENVVSIGFNHPLNGVALGEVDTGSCGGDTINGNVLFTGFGGNSSFAELDSATVHGSVTFSNNGGFLQEVESNHIDGSLSCSGNSNITNDGHPNTVTGQKTGQCASF